MFSSSRCFVNPCRKIACVDICDHLDHSAAVAALMLYYKLADNRRDSGLPGRVLWNSLTPFASKARRRALKTAPQADLLIAKAMERQAALETARCTSVDEACDPSASALAGITSGFTEDPDQARVLERLGYLIGRYVYLCDALDDMEKDTKTGNYNPFLLRGGPDKESIIEGGKSSLYLTVGEIAKTYALLSPKRFQPILDNILYLGLKSSVDEILKKKAKKEQPAE